MAKRMHRKAKGKAKATTQERVASIVAHGNALILESAKVATILQSVGRIIERPSGERLLYALGNLAEEDAERFAAWAEFAEFEWRRAEQRVA